MNKFPKLLFFAAFSVSAIFLISCASPKTENAAAPTEPIKITVSTSYEPKSIAVKKGQPVRLAFYRKDDKNCGGEVVFPKLGIKKELPVGETVSVEFTPQETGDLAFTCGMNMMRGKILVQ
ncbi:MAG TPA: cupredoxin domain-containing protein [Pyrinomonadaceae bacterium]|nr:cupredoxin domain-containing protein [Pyrinomonadaceae bacterium]